MRVAGGPRASETKAEDGLSSPSVSRGPILPPTFFGQSPADPLGPSGFLPLDPLSQSGGDLAPDFFRSSGRAPAVVPMPRLSLGAGNLTDAFCGRVRFAARYEPMSEVSGHDPGRRRFIRVIGGAITIPWLGCGGHVAAGQSDASPQDGSGGPDASGSTLDATTDASTTMEPDVTSATDALVGDDGSVSVQDASVPTDACLPTGNVAVVPFAMYPGLDGEAGYARLMVPCYRDPICGENVVIVVRTPQGEYLAFSDSCTHACCWLNFTGSQLVCPCCDSVFDMQGNVVSGPAPQPIPVFATRWDENAVYVTL